MCSLNKTFPFFLPLTESLNNYDKKTKKPLTIKQWTYPFKYGSGPESCKLSECKLHEHHGHADEEQHDDEGEEEGPSAVAVTQVGEAPHVAQPHRVAEERHEEVKPAGPVAPRVGVLDVSNQVVVEGREHRSAGHILDKLLVGVLQNKDERKLTEGQQQGRMEMFTHSTHFIYGYMESERKPAAATWATLFD